MKKLFSMLMAGAMMVGLLAGCGNTPATSTSSSTPDTVAAFKIGGTGPLTGGAAIYGNAVKNGAQIAVDEINALGTAVQFELNMQDDEHDAEKAVNAYNNLMDWGMQVSLVAVTSKPGEAISVYHNDDRVFGLTPSGSAPAVVEGKDNVYQLCFSDPNQGTASANYIADQGLATKVAVIYKNDDVYSKGIYDTFMAQAKVRGLEVVSETTFTTATENDFNVQLTEAKNAGAELLFLPMYYTPASLILTQADAMGYEPKFFGVDGMDGILTIENFNTELAEGVMLLTPFNADATDEKTASFVAKYQAQFGEIPNQFAADAYDCVYAYYQALTNANATPDMSAETLCGLMMEQFSTMSFDGLTGEGMTWTNGMVDKAPKGMIIENGAYVGM
ncbi:MAG: amino acid ABC transporter substrate-binding protein [Ruminococcaceae bacterium]|nr:amino acid ABC transporter substrate-binding protein [Oscillospiraceae bacterium]